MIVATVAAQHHQILHPIVYLKNVENQHLNPNERISMPGLRQTALTRHQQVSRWQIGWHTVTQDLAGCIWGCQITISF